MKKLLLTIVIIMVITLMGCSNNNTITPEKAKEWLDTKDNVVLVDVRTKAEYDNEHIPGALLVPVETIDTEALKKIPDKNLIYLVYCRTGRRSATAVKILEDLGYKKVYDLGGINSWPYEKTS